MVLIKLARYVLIIFLVFGILGFSNVVFASENVFSSSESTLNVNPSSASDNSMVPLLKGGKSVGADEIQDFMNQPTNDKIFVILSALVIVIFVIWYTLSGKNMNLMLRIPIIIVLLLLIFVPLYLAGNMIYLIVAAFTAVVVLIATWYEAHGSKMSKKRLMGSLIGAIVLLALVVGLPVYYYFTASEEITNVTVSSSVPGLEIVDYKAYRNTYTSTNVEFGGYVKNNGNSSAEFLKVNATGYDANGNVVSNITTYTSAETLLPGSNATFGYLLNMYPDTLNDTQKKIVRVELEVIKPTY